MAATRLGPLFVHALGAPRKGGVAILLCHGFGAPGDDLVPLGRAMDAGPGGVRWFFPEAPLTIDVGGSIPGRAWWQVDLMRLQELRMRGTPRRLAEETPDGMLEAHAALEGVVDALREQHGIERKDLVIGGFSQGAMLAADVALFSPEPFAGLVMLSGSLVSETRWKPRALEVGASIHALVTHGRADPMLPFEGSEAVRDLLVASGAHVTWVPHGGQHEIPNVALAAFSKFARERLAR